MVMFINHMPGNPWYWYTPSRFGFSDAAEAFVFLSGYSCALAYGRRFETDGFWRATQRVMRRWLKIYAAHLLSFGLMLVVCLLADRWAPGMNSWQRLNMDYFFHDTPRAVVDAITLSYVPNYFDILPLYLLLLAGLPLFWLLSRIHAAVAIAASLGLYWAAAHFGWSLVGDPRSGQSWYFNPMHWQLMFFSGVVVAAGWFRLPEKHDGLLGICLLIVLLSIPLAYQPLYNSYGSLSQIRTILDPWLDKNCLGGLRWLHSMALIYLAWQLIRWRQKWLNRPSARLITCLGQYSLPIYLVVMMHSYLAGIVFIQLPLQNGIFSALFNLCNLALLLVFGQVLVWFERVRNSQSPLVSPQWRRAEFDCHQSWTK